MKKSRTNLKEALTRNNKQVLASEPEPENVESVDAAKSKVSPSRQGKKPVIAYFDKEAHHQLKLFGSREGYQHSGFSGRGFEFVV